MNKPTDTTLRNRTGIKASPIDSKKMIEAAERAIPDAMVSTEPAEMNALRLEYSSSAPPVGTMPLPASLEGAAKTAAKMIEGENGNVFLDHLAARLAFERTGTRLYDALLVKHEAASVHEGGPTREDLLHIRDQELEHALMLIRCIEELGGDPTAMTPAADIQAVASSGIPQVLADPRTTLSQALEAVLIAELADVDSWEMLLDLAEGLGQDEMAERFQLALSQEEEHLASVRQWVATSLLGQAGIDVSTDDVEEEQVDEDADTGLHPPPSSRS
ncbi:MAG TPA: ferritin-like domain-containing protein [Kofleriaceae bacterium]|nr:ferritin-like domain-containing protein [Kofleriaceae bacterium]